jgi:hypothetical protein
MGKVRKNCLRFLGALKHIFCLVAYVLHCASSRTFPQHRRYHVCFITFVQMKVSTVDWITWLMKLTEQISCHWCTDRGLQTVLVINYRVYSLNINTLQFSLLVGHVIKMSFMVCTLYQILLGWSYQENKICRACFTHVNDDACIQNLSENLKVRDSLGDLGIYGRLILKVILNRQSIQNRDQ